MRNIAVVAAFALACAVAASALAGQATTSPNVHQASLGGERTLTAGELHAFLNGRKIRQPADGRSFVHTFNRDGTVTTETDFAKPWTGIWRVGENGHVTLIWNGRGSASWGVKADASGRHFHSKSGLELVILH